MITDQSMRDEVKAALDGAELGEDLETIVAAVAERLHAKFGLVRIDDIEHGAFWKVVEEEIMNVEAARS